MVYLNLLMMFSYIKVKARKKNNVKPDIYFVQIVKKMNLE